MHCELIYHFCHIFTALSQEENAMGRFLKANSKEDKTRAGKMMAGVGKAQSFSSQQRYQNTWIIMQRDIYLFLLPVYRDGVDYVDTITITITFSTKFMITITITLT